jgi:hypothetical protein
MSRWLGVLLNQFIALTLAGNNRRISGAGLFCGARGWDGFCGLEGIP